MRPTALLLALLIITVTGWSQMTGSQSEPPGERGAASHAQSRSGSTAAQGNSRSGTTRTVPTRIVIPSIGVDAPLVAIGLDHLRRLEPPPLDRPDIAGWYSGAPVPGQNGTSVAVGHLDTRKGPAVFARLSRLRPGARIDVARSDGNVARFEVDKVRSYAKRSFPTREVYDSTGRPELRTITCAGAYGADTGYRDNLVVYSHLVGQLSHPSARSRPGPPPP
ncbi:class F sortase [Streptomyces sp. BH097]|uniref:class F sortase n=1 Tax=unclassified Streptomyces TaxID=2593676 RepID=UPI003BB50617